MKKTFQYLGVLVLLCISFIYTEKTASVVKEMDQIMIEIKEYAKTYKVEPIEAILKDNTIIPGINGSEIDVNKSYQDMRMIGMYNEKYLKYKSIKVSNLLLNNKDKYIINGNPKKQQISMVFLVESRSNIEKILEIVNNNGIKVNFFIDGTWLENNNDTVMDIAREEHVLGNLSYNYDYSNTSLTWIDTVIKRFIKQENSYCIKTDDNGLKVCSMNKNYTIEPIIINENPLINTKRELKNGAILAYKINSKLENELDLIIKYVQSKGLAIETLNVLLQE